MCGIAGWFRMGKEQLNDYELTNLLQNLQVRGRHATGVAWRTPDKIKTLKGPGPAEQFIARQEFKDIVPEILASPYVLLHTRNATHGSPSDNKNNHPIMNDRGVIIHNGVVYPKKNLPAIGETDSEQIMLHIQKDGWSGLKSLSGTMAIAYIDLSTNGFYLFNQNQSLVWSYDSDRKIFFFCSTEAIIGPSIDLPKQFGLIDTMSFSDMPEGVVYHVNKNGIKEVATIEKERPGWYRSSSVDGDYVP